jgi:imidazolonepropionase-like amidohydrolase
MLSVSFICLLSIVSARAQAILFEHGVIHTVSGRTLTNGSVLIQSGKIVDVFDGSRSSRIPVPTNTTSIDLHGQHLYPGLIALDSALGLTEISAVRATQDTTEVGDYTPDVQSWIAVNPDSELIPVARANGIAFFEPVPKGNIVAGQSALLAMNGWTYEQMAIRKPVALHLYWPAMELNLVPKDKSRDAKWKSLEDQAKERRAKLRAIQEFFDEAHAYAKARIAAANGTVLASVPAWEAMVPYVRGELPIVIHANEVRQIRAVVSWAATNHFKVILAGGRDAWMLADVLAILRVPLVYESAFVSPARDTETYDVHFTAPALLHQAGVKVAFSVGSDSFGAGMTRNLPYAAAQAIAFGLPENEALKGLTLFPAELMGVADRVGSIEAGKDATVFICDGDLFDLRSNVQRMWIAGQEVSLGSRHTRLYEKYRNRPKP